MTHYFYYHSTNLVSRLEQVISKSILLIIEQLHKRSASTIKPSRILNHATNISLLNWWQYNASNFGKMLNLWVIDENYDVRSWWSKDYCNWCNVEAIKLQSLNICGSDFTCCSYFYWAPSLMYVLYLGWK